MALLLDGVVKLLTVLQGTWKLACGRTGCNEWSNTHHRSEQRDAGRLIRCASVVVWRPAARWGCVMEIIWLAASYCTVVPIMLLREPMLLRRAVRLGEAAL